MRPMSKGLRKPVLAEYICQCGEHRKLRSIVSYAYCYNCGSTTDVRGQFRGSIDKSDVLQRYIRQEIEDYEKRTAVDRYLSLSHECAD